MGVVVELVGLKFGRLGKGMYFESGPAVPQDGK